MTLRALLSLRMSLLYRFSIVLYPHTRVDIQERMDVILLVTINHVNIGLFTLNRPYNNNEKEH